MNVSIDIKDTDIKRKRLKKDRKLPKLKKPLFKKPIDKKKAWKIVLWAVVILLVGGGGYYGVKAYKFAQDVGIEVTAGDVINPIKKDPELKKDSTGKYTNALIVGIDTRENNGSLQNTDTIMVVSYNHETSDIVMLSLPRDFFVEVPDEGWYSKVNALYGHGEKLEEGGGLIYLQKALEDILDLEIQYYAMVDLKGFKDIIDAVGGVTVNVENAFTDYSFPTEDPTKPLYEAVSFEAGPQLMDGETALKYARSRKSQDSNEGNDFARAKRQQNVIIALKNKVLSSDTLLNPQKVLEIMAAVQDNVKLSEFTVEDIQAGINIAQKQKDSEGTVSQFVLDPSIGDWSILTTKGLTTDNAYVIGPKLGLGVYDDLQKIVRLYFKYPELYSEKAIVRTYDVGLGYQESYDKTEKLRKELPFIDIQYMGVLFSDKKNISVYDHTEDNLNNDTVDKIADILKTEKKSQPAFITTNLNGEDVTVVFGAPPTSDETITEE